MCVSTENRYMGMHVCTHLHAWMCCDVSVHPDAGVYACMCASMYTCSHVYQFAASHAHV